MDNNQDLEKHNIPHNDVQHHGIKHESCGKPEHPWYENTNLFDELSKHWNDDCHHCYDNHHCHDEPIHHEQHKIPNDHHESKDHDHKHHGHHHLTRYELVLGPHCHNGLPMHCHDPRPHHCNLPFSHKSPSKPFIDFHAIESHCPWNCHSDRNDIHFKIAYGHVHDLNGNVRHVDEFDCIKHNDCHDHCDGHDCHSHCHDHHICADDPFDFIKPWSPYDAIGFNKIPQKGEKPLFVTSNETQKSTEIRDSLGNLRFVVSLASYVPSTGNAFDIRQHAKMFLIDVLSYCYCEQPINLFHKGFYDFEQANKCYVDKLHQYELIAKVETKDVQDIQMFADKIGYTQLDKCCATCKWAKKIDREDNLFDKHKADHFIDGHHMDSHDITDHKCHPNWPNHEIRTTNEKYMCLNREIFSMSEVGDAFSVQPEVMGNCVCDKYEPMEHHEDHKCHHACQSHIRHEYDEYGHSIYKFFDRNGKGKLA